jgi:hypothetical protein
MIHETRIIPLDDRPWPPATMKSWMGTSRGHFDGNTLVVVTRNLNGKTGMQGNGMMLIPSDAIEITERFAPISANILQYEVTINDPKTWTRPWKVSFPPAPRQQLPDIRIRVSRGQLRDAQHVVRAREPTKGAGPLIRRVLPD